MFNDTIINYLIGIGGILIGVLVSIYTYVKSKETKEPQIYYQTYREIEKISEIEESNIKILYKTEEVERVYTTYVWFWNKGRKPILKSDIPVQAGIRLRLTDNHETPNIIDYKIIKQSREPINVEIRKYDETSLEMGFDFLDYMDGWVMEIQHTGGFNTIPIVEGVILGNADGVKIKSENTSMLERPTRRYLRGNPRYVRKPKPKDFLIYSIPTLLILIPIVILSIPRFLPNYSPNLTITESELVSVVKAELPNTPETSIQSILTLARQKDDRAETPLIWKIIGGIFGVFILGQFLFAPIIFGI